MNGKVTESTGNLTLNTNTKERKQKESRTEDEIEKFLGKVCDFIPSGTDRAACHVYVNSSTPDIINWIENEQPPKTVCDELHLCNTAEKDDVGDFQCSACDVLVNAVEEYVAAGSSEAEIEVELETVCNDLPGFLSVDCTTIVKNYTPAMVQWIENQENPQKFCTSVGLCTAF